jgi:hypothetical protein
MMCVVIVDHMYTCHRFTGGVRFLLRLGLPCHCCTSNKHDLFRYLSTDDAAALLGNDIDRKGYIHLIVQANDERIDADSHQLARLFQSKSMIHAVLIKLIDVVFTDLCHSDTFLSELLEQYPRLMHVFYAHFLPWIIQHMHCLFDQPIDTCLNSSLDIVATMFAVACRKSSPSFCSLCNEFDLHHCSRLVEQCSFLFADEIQRIRSYYTNFERCSNNNEFTMTYSSMNTVDTCKATVDNMRDIARDMLFSSISGH